MTPEEKTWIDNASMEDLLRKWRFVPIGDPYFREGELSRYFQTRMTVLRRADPDAWTAASKKVGW